MRERIRRTFKYALSSNNYHYLQEDGWKLSRTNYYQEGWLATANVRGVVGVTYTSSFCAGTGQVRIKSFYCQNKPILFVPKLNEIVMTKPDGYVHLNSNWPNWKMKF